MKVKRGRTLDSDRCRQAIDILRVLFYLSAGRPRSVTQIANYTGIKIRTIRRYLKAIERVVPLVVDGSDVLVDGRNLFVGAQPALYSLPKHWLTQFGVDQWIIDAIAALDNTDAF